MSKRPSRLHSLGSVSSNPHKIGPQKTISDSRKRGSEAGVCVSELYISTVELVDPVDHRQMRRPTRSMQSHPGGLFSGVWPVQSVSYLRERLAARYTLHARLGWGSSHSLMDALPRLPACKFAPRWSLRERPGGARIRRLASAS